jgi:hypothetical protein
MGLLDDMKGEVQKRYDRRATQVQQHIDQRITEVKSYWESMIGNLTQAFNTNPMYQNEYGTPQEFIMGEQFEQFSLNLFHDHEYLLLNRTHDFETNEMRYVEESKFYDFKLQHRQTGYKFAVECKFRSNLYHDKYNWAKEFQMKRYKKYEKEHLPNGYYVMMGLGGEPGYPDGVHLMPLSDIKYVGLFTSVLDKYLIPPNYIRCDGRRLYL